jgi:hypothetical protein
MPSEPEGFTSLSTPNGVTAECDIALPSPSHDPTSPGAGVVS